MLLVIIEKFETNPMLINVNKLKLYKYMESEVQKKRINVNILEQNVGGVQEANFDTKEDNERCEIQNFHVQNVEDKEQIIDLIVNTIFIFNLQMNNNYKSVGFGMQRSNDDMSGILATLVAIFIQSSKVFTYSLELWAQLTEKPV